MKKFILIKTLFFVAFIFATVVCNSQTTYNLVTNSSDLEAGKKYLIVGQYPTNTFVALGKRPSGNSYSAVSISENGGQIIATAAVNLTDETSPYEIEIGGSSGAWTLFDALTAAFGSNGGYLKPRDGNNNGLQNTTEAVTWNIVIAANGLATITATNTTTFPRGRMRYNYNNTIFSCYNNSAPYENSVDVYIYKSEGVSTEPRLIVSNPIINGSDVSIAYTIQNLPEGKVKYALDRGPYTCTSNNPIILRDVADGEHVFSIELVDSECSSLNPQILRTITFRIGETPIEITPISTIRQGQANGLQFENQIVWVEGIVTFIEKQVGGDRDGQQNGFYMQDDRAAWSGIYVYDRTNIPTVGNTVRLQAKVSEYYNLTELTNISEYIVTSTTTSVPEPITLDCATAGTKNYESCYVKISDFEVLESLAYGNYKVKDESGNFNINKTHQIQSFNIVIGSHYCATGVVNFRDIYRLLPALISGPCEVGIVLNNFANTEIYPNPANDFIHIKTEEINVNIKIINISGQKILEKNNVQNGEQININNLESGVYIVKISSNNGIAFRKLIK